MSFGRLPNPRPPRNPAAEEAKVATQLYPRHPDDELNLLGNQLDSAQRQLIGAAAIADKRGALGTHKKLLVALSVIDDARAGLVQEGDDG